MSKIKTLQEKDMKKVASQQKVVKIVVQVLLYLFLIVMALVVIFPFYMMIVSSLKPLDEFNLQAINGVAEIDKLSAAEKTLHMFYTKNPTWENYGVVFTNPEFAFGKLLFNTIYVGVISTLLSLVITVLTAFAFARLEFKGKDTLFAVLLGTMMIPGELFTITNFQTVSAFGWMDTFTVLIVPFLVSVFYIYLLKQNFMQIPNELYLAAKVDGTTDLKYLWKVMIPLSLPTLISITILKMMGSWNSYMWPTLVTEEEHYLITNGIRSAGFNIDFTKIGRDYVYIFERMIGEGGQYQVNVIDSVNIPIQMAAVFLVSLPLFLVFVFLRKYIMKGVSRSGIKG